MEFSELIKSRYSVRKYSERKVEDEKLKTILEAARIAPTAKDIQPFKVYVLKSDDSIKKIREKTSMAFDAPIVLMIVVKLNEVWKSPFRERADLSTDCAIVTDHMMLQAHALGLGTCWVGYFDPKIMKEAFNLPDDEEVINLMPLGYKADDCEPGPLHSKRKSFDELFVVL